MPDSDPWRIIVLAAGRGTRMGGPKALMAVGKRPWWQTQEGRLAAAARTWVVSPQVAAQMGGCASPLVLADPEAPMFDSLRAGIDAAGRNEGILVLPVDVPAPASSTIAALTRAAGAGVAVPVHRARRGHPVALSRGWINRVLLPACAAGQNLRLDHLIEPDARVVPVDDPDTVVNLNTPRDVDRWLAAQGAG